MQDSENNISPENYGKIKSPFLTKLENFFYHYKWHTIIALFLVFTITVCSLQMCKKKEYDFYIMYAGGTVISMSAEEGKAESEYESLLGNIKRFVPDFDGDGLKSVSINNLYIPSSEQIKEMESNADEGYFVNYTQIQSNRDIFRQSTVYGEYSVIIMSESLYRELTAEEKNNPLAPISAYLPEGALENGYILAGEYGVYLSSTPLADNPGFSELEEGTVISIRRNTSLGSNKSTDKMYEQSEKVLRFMLADKAAD